MNQMSRQESSALSIENIVLGAYEKYNAHMDNSANDYLLVVGDNLGSAVGKRLLSSIMKRVTDLAGPFVYDYSGRSVTNLPFDEETYSFLNVLLAPTDTFFDKYFLWIMRLQSLEAKLNRLKEIQTLGIPPALHRGMLMYSATADTERKIKEDFGGVKWRRIVNFPLLVADKNRDNCGRRGGESFVSLNRDNIPNHIHTLKQDTRDTTKKDVWKLKTGSGGAKLISKDAPGFSMGSKLVFPEVAPLNWNEDWDSGSIHGASRYVKPHFNIPPYKDVYIWECVTVSSEQTAGSATGRTEVTWSEVSQATTRDSTPRWDNLASFAQWDKLQTFMSDELAGEQGTRFDSKDVTLEELADLASWYVWCDKLHIERRYLFRDAYRHLISDVQDRIYKIIKDFNETTGKTKIYPEAVKKGQYLFFYGLTKEEEQEKLTKFYRLPKGCEFVEVSNAFLRGTSMFTSETESLFKMYTGADRSTAIKTSGGLETVNLYPENFPKHLHWSTLLTGMPSVNAAPPTPNMKSGGQGTTIMMNDPRSGGIKYCSASGTGPYKFDTEQFGTDTAINHTNMPAYLIMSVYQVS